MFDLAIDTQFLLVLCNPSAILGEPGRDDPRPSDRLRLIAGEVGTRQFDQSDTTGGR